MNLSQPLSSHYRTVVMDAAIPQAVILGFTMIMTDGGAIQSIILVAMAGYWAGAVLHIMRHPSVPTRGALFRLRWGFFFLLVPAFAAQHAWEVWRG